MKSKYQLKNQKPKNYDMIILTQQYLKKND
jgi:hypothetical protein